MLFPEHVLSDFQPPRIKKNIKKCYTVCKNQGFQKFPLPTAAIEKCTPKWPQNGSNQASGAIKMRIKSAVCFECYFRTIFGRFLSPKWAPKCAQKSLKHLPWGPQGPPRTPPAGRRPPGSTFGAFWNPCSTHLAGSSWLFWGCGSGCLGCFGLWLWSWWFCFWLFSFGWLLWLLAPFFLQPPKLKQLKVESPGSLNP